DLLEDEDVLPGRARVQMETALELVDGAGRGARLVVDGREAGRDDDSLRLAGAALHRRHAGGGGEPDQQLGLDALAPHLLQHGAGRRPHRGSATVEQGGALATREAPEATRRTPEMPASAVQRSSR